MTGWTADELARVGSADELGIASRRADGSLRQYITIWVVRSGDDLYVRSAYGRDNRWFQLALASGEGRSRPLAWSGMSRSRSRALASTTTSTRHTT